MYTNYYYASPEMRKVEQMLIEEYGTADLEIIELIKRYADKQVQAMADSKYKANNNDMFPRYKYYEMEMI